jgi:hypothetical protein
MGLQPPKPLTEPEAICTGFVRIVATPNPFTLGIKVQRPENDIQFALSRDECAKFAAILLRFAATE